MSPVCIAKAGGRFIALTKPMARVSVPATSGLASLLKSQYGCR